MRVKPAIQVIASIQNAMAEFRERGPLALVPPQSEAADRCDQSHCLIRWPVIPIRLESFHFVTLKLME